jgi:oxygen-independent coproporphyrinogen-3 oxidase
MNLALYIHFPFCLSKCLYCDFNSVAGAQTTPEEYANILVREMELRATLLPPPTTATTLYFGGGTPSLMAPELVGRIIAAAARLYGLATSAEITLEANPGTLNRAKLAGYRAAGVNRLSLGIQSFDDVLLNRMGRVHTAKEALAAYEMARTAGFANVSIDLIHSLPGQTPEMWQTALRRAVQLAPEHVSAYGLTIEEGTPYHALQRKSLLPLPSEDEAADMFEATAALLEEAGYEQYEISNFALLGCRSRHNQVYWRRGSYLGFGAGAHSFLAAPASGVRWQNAADLQSYTTALGHATLPEEGRQILSRDEALAEYFFLGLRMLEGITTESIKQEFGPDWDERYAPIIRDLTAQGLLIAADGRLRLSAKSILLSNQVFSRFL